MKTWFRSLRRGSQITLVLLLVTVITASAWGLWLFWTGASVFSVEYAAPPQDLGAEIEVFQCTVSNGGEAGAIVYDPVTNLATCPFSNISDTSVMTMGLQVDNTSGGAAVAVTYIAPVTTCFDVSMGTYDGLPISINQGAKGAQIQAILTGNAETLGCAIANTVEDFAIEVQIDPQ